MSVGIEAVHLDQNLVERLLPLVMRPTQTGAAMATHSIDLINENDARAITFGLLEEVANPARADADKHLHKLGPGDGEERHTRFAGHRLGHQSFACARTADQQHAFGDACAKADELLRLLQKLDDLLQLFLGFVATSYVIEPNSGMIAGEHARPALAKRHRLIVAALRLPKNEVEEADDKDRRQKDADQIEQPTPLAGPLIDDDRLSIRVTVALNAIRRQHLFNRTHTADTGARGLTVLVHIDNRHLAAAAGDDQFSNFI